MIIMMMVMVLKIMLIIIITPYVWWFSEGTAKCHTIITIIVVRYFVMRYKYVRTHSHS